MKVNCPECGKLVEWDQGNPYRPFCSERCKMVDLGEWALGYRFIPGEKLPQDEETGEDDPSLPAPY